MKKRKRYWVVLKVHGWSAGLFFPPPEGPHGFLPVFNTKQQAVKWAGSEKHVREARPV